ncbi:MAG: hypothetical protein M3Y33_11260, partial [Actinomycetota bacterium]|nr:hypothetical protein [Actinomycetota bacterium]
MRVRTDAGGLAGAGEDQQGLGLSGRGRLQGPAGEGVAFDQEHIPFEDRDTRAGEAPFLQVRATCAGDYVVPAQAGVLDVLDDTQGASIINSPLSGAGPARCGQDAAAGRLAVRIVP